MELKILKLGHSTRHIEVPAGATVETALSQAEMGHHGYSLTLNGLGVDPETQVGEGDIITLVPKVEGGA